MSNFKELVELYHLGHELKVYWHESYPPGNFTALFVRFSGSLENDSTMRDLHFLKLAADCKWRIEDLGRK